MMVLEEFFNELKKYAGHTSHVESVLVVGSYARGTNKESSDLDIVIVTPNKSAMIADQEFTQRFGKVFKQQMEYYGACTSIHVWYEDGKIFNVIVVISKSTSAFLSHCHMKLNPKR